MAATCRSRLFVGAEVVNSLQVIIKNERKLNNLIERKLHVSKVKTKTEAFII